MSGNQYGEFAHSYDLMMNSVDYRKWVVYLESFLREHGAQTVLDAACGTGKITVALARDGFKVTGSDLSEDMLMEARAHALESGQRLIPFVCQNMTDISVHRPVDAVISTCDGVNYLTSLEEVERFFQSAFRCLKPGGLLFFDISSDYKLERILGNETFTEVTDDYAYIWYNSFDSERRLIEMDLTFFVKRGGTYSRFQEEHVQRAHSIHEIVKLLNQTGFSAEGIYDAFTREPVRPESERIQFAAIRQEEKDNG